MIPDSVKRTGVGISGSMLTPQPERTATDSSSPARNDEIALMGSLHPLVGHPS